MDDVKAGVVQSHQQKLAEYTRIEKELQEKDVQIYERDSHISALNSKIEAIQKEKNSIETSLQKSVKELQEIDKIMDYIKTENKALTEKLKDAEHKHQMEIHLLKASHLEVYTSQERDKNSMALMIKAIEKDNISLQNDITLKKEQNLMDNENWRLTLTQQEEKNYKFIENLKASFEQEIERRLNLEKSWADSKIYEFQTLVQELEKQKKLLVSDNYNLKQDLDNAKSLITTLQSKELTLLEKLKQMTSNIAHAQEVDGLVKTERNRHLEQENKNLNGIIEEKDRQIKLLRSRADSYSNIEVLSKRRQSGGEQGRNSFGGHERGESYRNYPKPDILETRANLDYLLLKRCQEIGKEY